MTQSDYSTVIQVLFDALNIKMKEVQAPLDTELTLHKKMEGNITRITVALTLIEADVADLNEEQADGNGDKEERGEVTTAK